MWQRSSVRVSEGPGRMRVMPIAPRVPHRLKRKIFRGSRAIKRGLLTRSELRSSAWRRLFRDVYADAALGDSHELRCSASGAFLLPPGAAIAGRSAAHLHGGPALRPGDPVE